MVIRKNADDLSDWLDRAQYHYQNFGADVANKPAVIRFPNGAVIRTGHLKDDQAYTKYQGHEYQRLLIEELTQIPTEERYLRLLSSCRSTVPELKPRVFLTTNPGGQGHAWVKERFVDIGEWGKRHHDKKTGRSRIFIPAKVDDNPTIVDNDPDYIKMLEGLPETLMKAWRYGDWDIFAGQFFPEFRRDIHVVRPMCIPSGWLKFRALDYGYENPSCCLWAAVDYDGKVYVYRELYKKGLTYEQLAYEIGQMTPPNEKIEYTIADTEMFAKTRDTGEYGHHIMGTEGVPIMQANKERIPGWNIVRQYLKNNRIVFCETCYNLTRTLPAMIHLEEPKNVEDLDTTLEDHAVDALRYLLMSIPGKPKIEDETIPPPVYANDPSAPWNKKKGKRGYNQFYSHT